MSLQDKLKTLPSEPGCYLMKNASGTIIYIGKAKSLKSRVTQYFTGAHDYKTTKLVSEIDDFDLLLTQTDKEALLLELNLIKKHRPKYNIMFMDDKSYPYIKITADAYPRLTIARDFRKKDKKAHYFGPFPNAQAARTMVSLLNFMYPLRKCVTMPKKVCLYYHLGQCLGPCEFSVDQALYQGMLDEVTLILKGDVKFLRSKLVQEMNHATEHLAYEKAKEYRDYIQALDHVVDKQNVTEAMSIDRDYFNYYEADGFVSMVVIMVRQGTLIDRHLVTQSLVDDAHESLTQFIMQYYDQQLLPKEIYVPVGLDQDVLQLSLEAKVFIAQRGQHRKMLDLALKNATQQHQQHLSLIKRKAQESDEALDKLKELLQLTSVDTIELIDNSHTGGSYASSAVVVFKQGIASKKDYRLYNVSSRADDLKNMQEVVYRRYLRVLKEQRPLPQLILIDGGYQQVKVAQQTLQQLGFVIPIYGLVKDQRHQSSALISVADERIELYQYPALFFLLARMQDEVHRFVIQHHRKRRSKGLLHSQLDDIEGLGPKRKQALLKQFKTVDALKAASVEELSKWIPQSVVLKLKAHLQQDEDMV